MLSIQRLVTGYVVPLGFSHRGMLSIQVLVTGRVFLSSFSRRWLAKDSSLSSVNMSIFGSAV